MIKPVVVRLTSQSGASVASYAQRLGRSCSTTDKPSGYQVQDGYILKAARNLKGYTVTVLDTPLFLMLSGTTQTLTTTPNPSTPVGARDSFLYFPALGTAPKTYEAVEDAGNFYVPPAQPKDPVEAVIQLVIWAPVQWRGGIFCLGTKRLPFLSNPVGFNVDYDSYEAFPFSQTVTLTGKMATFLTCSQPKAIVDQLRNTYLGLAHFNVSEEDLPGDWTHHPRRLVAGQTYTNFADSYRTSRRAAALWQFGVAWSLAGEMEAEADTFCMASEIYNQLRTTWTTHDGETYNPPYYDREGEHALGVFIGRLARDTYDPAAAVPLYAELISQFMVKAVDLPVPDLRPYPADISGWAGGPSRPNFGYFIDPLVLRTTGGFTAFCAYRHNRVADARKVRAMLVVTPDQTTHVLKADSYPNNHVVVYPSPTGETYDLDLPGYDPDVRCNPWLVGGFTVDGVDSFGEVTHTAFALVYEHDDSVAAEQLIEFPLPYVNIGQSKWALYVVESGVPTRAVLTEVTPSASTMGVLLSAAFNYPITTEGSTTPWLPYSSDIAKRQRLCNFANAGNGLAVTASIDKPFPMVAWSAGSEDRSYVAAHDVKCAVVNLLDGTIEQRGTIFVRNRIFTWCFITVAQPYAPGDPGAGIPETQPVLIASTHETTTDPDPAGKCWMSVDGGWTWDEYVTDVGAQMGAHLVGNRLFEYDPLKPFL